jgi:ribose transport system permease protein
VGVSPAAPADIANRTVIGELRIFLRRAPWVPAVSASVILFFLGGVVAPGYSSWLNLNQILAAASVLTFASAGQTFVMISGEWGIDLSVGQVMSLAAVVAYIALGGQDANLPRTFGLVLAVGAVFGLMNGIGVALIRLPPLIMTLASLVIAQGTVFLSTQGGSPAGGTAPILLALATNRTWGIRWIVFVAAGFVVAVEAILRRSRFGRMLFLVGSNRKAAEVSGLRVLRYVFATYFLAGIFNGIAGLVLLGYAGTANLDLGAGYLLPSIASVVIGGTSLAGGKGGYVYSAAGAVTLILLTTFLLAAGMSEALRQLITGLILLVLLAFNARSPGLRQ